MVSKGSRRNSVKWWYDAVLNKILVVAIRGDILFSHRGKRMAYIAIIILSSASQKLIYRNILSIRDMSHLKLFITDILKCIELV